MKMSFVYSLATNASYAALFAIAFASSSAAQEYNVLSQNACQPSVENQQHQAAPANVQWNLSDSQHGQTFGDASTSVQVACDCAHQQPGKCDDTEQKKKQAELKKKVASSYKPLFFDNGSSYLFHERN